MVGCLQLECALSDALSWPVLVLCFREQHSFRGEHVCSGERGPGLGTQARNGSLFPAAAVSLYCTYLAYSALVSEPHGYACNGASHPCPGHIGSHTLLGSNASRGALSLAWQARVA